MIEHKQTKLAGPVTYVHSYINVMATHYTIKVLKPWYCHLPLFLGLDDPDESWKVNACVSVNKNLPNFNARSEI